jgi:hypothetical protein
VRPDYRAFLDISEERALGGFAPAARASPEVRVGKFM